jgi:hypothetical protein
MNLNSYHLDSGPGSLTFEFYSEGPKGKIKKIIQFKKLVAPESPHDIYNLAFGDLKENGKIDDLSISDNKDSEKVLTTVATAVIAFTNKHPDVLISRREVQHRETDII